LSLRLPWRKLWFTGFYPRTPQTKGPVMTRRNAKRPERVIELAKQYAEARVEEEKLYREVIMGVAASVDLHQNVSEHRERLWEAFMQDVYEMAGIL